MEKGSIIVPAKDVNKDKGQDIEAEKDENIEEHVEEHAEDNNLVGDHEKEAITEVEKKKMCKSLPLNQ